MSSTVIRDFLVALTFKTDDTGAKKSKDALESNEKAAKTLSRALISLASIAVMSVAKTANELEKLFYSSKRIGASADNIRAYGDAIAQMGGSAEGAISSLESVARKLRESPGYEGMLKGLGVTTRDQNGQMRDRVEVMKDLSKTLQGMEYYKANNYANALGIDESTLMAMRDGKFTSEMEKYQKLRKDMGLNDELAKSGQEFAYQWRDMTMQLKALMEVIVMTAGKALIPVLKLLNQLIQFVIHWFGQLNPHIKAFLAAGLKIAMLTVVFGGLFSAIGKFAKLLPMLTGLLNIFKALRLVFLASPIGIVLALAAAIALLWDDYQTWKRGGESLIDWEKWAGGIETAINKIKELGKTLKNLQQKATNFILGQQIGDETIGDKVGRTVAKGLAFFGNKEAQAALDAEEMAKATNGSNTKQQSTQTLQQTALAGVNAIVGAANAIKGDVQEKVQANSSLKLGNKSDNRMMVYEAFLNAGLSKNQALAITAEVGRENEYNAKTMFGFHTDAAKDGKGNSISNMGFLSWNRERAIKLRNDLQFKGLLNSNGQVKQSQESLNAMAQFAVTEMKNKKYVSKLQNFWSNPNDDPENYAAEVGGKFVGWAYKQNTIKGANGTRIKFDWQPHDQRRRNNLNALQEDLKKESKVSDVMIKKDALAKFAKNAEIPNNINPIAPNFSNNQSSSRNVHINQKTDIHITGGDAMMTAKAVRKEQDSVNLQMTRNSKGVFG